MKHKPAKQEKSNQQKQADTGNITTTASSLVQPLMSAAMASSGPPPSSPATPQQPHDDQRKVLIVHAPSQVIENPPSATNHIVQSAHHQQQPQQQQPITSRRQVICSPVMPPEKDTSTLFPVPPTKVHQQTHCARNTEDTILTPPPTPVARKIEFDDDNAQPHSTRVNIMAATPPPPAPREPSTEANPVLEREIKLHQSVLEFKTFQLHNQRRRLLSEINFIDVQLRDVYDETQKYLNIQNRNKLQMELETHFKRFKY